MRRRKPQILPTIFTRTPSWTTRSRCWKTTGYLFYFFLAMPFMHLHGKVILVAHQSQDLFRILPCSVVIAHFFLTRSSLGYRLMAEMSFHGDKNVPDRSQSLWDGMVCLEEIPVLTGDDSHLRCPPTSRKKNIFVSTVDNRVVVRQPERAFTPALHSTLIFCCGMPLGVAVRVCQENGSLPQLHVAEQGRLPGEDGERPLLFEAKPTK